MAYIAAELWFHIFTNVNSNASNCFIAQEKSTLFKLSIGHA